ncbi:MAG: asparaginase [Heliobacteriaceae bacterium]|jgi:L-asparaginase II|nr:asparaginase [Heliobacteriaceae bacterium]
MKFYQCLPQYFDKNIQKTYAIIDFMEYNNTPQKLVQYVRSGLVEQEHYGFMALADKKGVIQKWGEDGDYPFYPRSCAKPLQAALIIDYGLDELCGMSLEEIALCCSSHAGEEVHINIAKNLLKKIGLRQENLKCGFHKPLSAAEQKKLILSDGSENIFQNNCVGKHIMMLALCRLNGWDLDGYCEPEHPLQIAVRDKISGLCNLEHRYPLTKDGCGVPIMSMPLHKMLNGYLNLFLNPKYEKIKNAFLDYPYIIGGENRLDTKIMEASGLIAKVGAGGLCIVVNLAAEEALIVKISDADAKARETAVVHALKTLRWADIEISREIKTLLGEVIGEIKACGL